MTRDALPLIHENLVSQWRNSFILSCIPRNSQFSIFFPRQIIMNTVTKKQHCWDDTLKLLSSETLNGRHSRVESKNRFQPSKSNGLQSVRESSAATRFEIKRDHEGGITVNTGTRTGSMLRHSCFLSYFLSYFFFPSSFHIFFHPLSPAWLFTWRPERIRSYNRGRWKTPIKRNTHKESWWFSLTCNAVLAKWKLTVYRLDM